MSKLSIKQQKLVDEYIKTGNAYQAAINAGYSESYARVDVHKALVKPSVKKALDERLEEIKSVSIADQTEIMQYLTSVMRGEVTDEELMTVPDGDFSASVERLERRSDTSARTKAAELLGKRYTMWTDKQVLNHEGVVQLVDDVH
ncbi:terminase small subunit [Staphylococcus xylosus]